MVVDAISLIVAVVGGAVALWLKNKKPEPAKPSEPSGGTNPILDAFVALLRHLATQTPQPSPARPVQTASVQTNEVMIDGMVSMLQQLKNQNKKGGVDEPKPN